MTRSLKPFSMVDLCEEVVRRAGIENGELTLFARRGQLGGAKTLARLRPGQELSPRNGDNA